MFIRQSNLINIVLLLVYKLSLLRKVMNCYDVSNALYMPVSSLSEIQMLDNYRHKLVRELYT